MRNDVKDFFEAIAPSWNNKKDDLNKIEEILKEVNIKVYEDILDLGCGKGIITPLIYKYTNKQK